MKLGIIERDIDVKCAVAQNMFSDYTKGAMIKEGKRLLKRYPNYKYLKHDPTLEDDNDFYLSIVYAYLADQILIENKNLKIKYDECMKEAILFVKESHLYEGKSGEPHRRANSLFVQWYHDYLREQADPGCIERERKEAERKQQALKDAKMMQEVRARIQTQQDLASGKRVVCPYCKSTNTEKISTMSRAVSVSLVGAASGKIGKQWHCKNCGSNF